MRTQGTNLDPMRFRHLIVAALVCGPCTAPAALSAPDSGRKAAVDRQLSRVEERARAARGREQVLTGELYAYSQKVRLLEVRLAPLAARRDHLASTESRLRTRLRTLSTQLQREQARLARVEDTLRARRLALSERVRALYRSNPTAGMANILQGVDVSRSATDAIASRRVTALDRELIRTVSTYAADVRATRDRVERLRTDVQADTRSAAIATRGARAAAAGLERSRNELNRVRSRKQALLAGIVESREDLEGTARDLRGQSLRLANEIIKAQGGPSASIGAPSAAGLVWPVNGPLTSRFGWRWGRMHEGVDVGVGTGTPIAAAAAGKVIVAGWSGGYGQLVVIDHGNGLSTAYGHQSRIASAVGQLVAQGTIIGYVGSTGNSTGPHLHFEVRVNGGARDPLAYL